MIIFKSIDKSRRLRMPSHQRGHILAGKVLFSNYNYGILLQPFDESKATEAEYIEGYFGTDDRITLPKKMCKDVGIEKVVSLKVNSDGTVLIKPRHAACLFCGSTEKLHAVGKRSNKYVCDRCFNRTE